MDSSRWTDPAWLATAHEWVDARLADLRITRTGDVEQPHVERWSTVLRVPTTDGPVWFKANDGSMRHEAAVAALLARRAPDRVPSLLAADVDRGWMLMADAGRRLREVVLEERSLGRWLDVLEATARIQIACEDAVDELLALGVPDMRLTALPGRYAGLMDQIGAEARFREAQATVEELAAALAPYGIAETIQHDDLHDGQVFVRDGRQLVMDWGDACVSHPFFTLSVTLEGQIAWGVDDEQDSEDVAPYREAYLAPYAAHHPDLTAADLTEAARIATRLGWACRAVNGHVPGDDRSTLTRLRMFLDGTPG